MTRHELSAGRGMERLCAAAAIFPLLATACLAAGTPTRADMPAAQPSWAVPYGAEFWHPIRAAKTPPAGAPADDALPLRLGEAVDRVSHAFAGGDGHAGVRSRTYRAVAGAVGWRFEPRPPPAPAAEAGLVFRTSEILRGGRPLPLAATPARHARGNTVQTLLRTSPDVVEHVEARGGGLEVSWVFDSAPAGAGDLEIRLALEGLASAGETTAGFHFADARGVPRVRIGRARAVDSAGRAWDLATSAADGSLAVAVPEAVLREAAWPLAVDPVISAEFGLDSSVHLVPDPDQQGEPAVASDGTNWFVAWSALSGLMFDSDIRATRISPAGAVLDPAGIDVSTAADWQSSPAVAWNGTNFFVVWEDSRSGADSDIYGARVAPDGAVLDAAGIAIGTNTNDQRGPSIAWNSGVHYVAWEEGSYSAANIRGARVAPDGTVLDAGGSNLCTAARRQALPSVAPLGTGFMIVWDDERNTIPDIYGARVSGSGELLDPSGISISQADDAQQNPALAWNGTNCVVIWGDARDGVSFNIHGARISPAGAILDATGFPVCTQSGDQDEAAIAWTGSRFLVAWADWRNGTNTDYDIYAARLDGGGALLDGGSGFLVAEAPGYQGATVAATSGTNVLIAWTDMRKDADIYAARVSDAGAVLDAPPFAAALAPNRQYAPAVASDGTNWLAVWEDDRGGVDFDLYGARTDATGLVLDVNGFVVAAATNDQVRPCLLWNGTNYFAAWTDYRRTGADGDIFATRISPAGAALDPTGIVVCTNESDQEGVAASWDGTNHLCVWTDQRGPDQDIFGARVNAAGVVLDPVTNLQISFWTGTAQFNPTVAWNGTTHLVVWQDYRDDQADLYGARMTPGGTVLDIGGLALCTETNDQTEPAIAWDGIRYLLAWSDSRGQTNSSIYAGRLSSAAAPLDGSGFAVAVHGGDHSAPRIAWDGYTHVVAWNRTDLEGNADILFARVTQSGSVLDPEGLTALTNATEAALASRNGRSMIAAAAPRDGLSRVTAALVANDLVRLTVASSHGAPSPDAGSHVYNANTMVAPSMIGSPVAGASTQFVCTGWTGTGSVPGIGSTTNIPAFPIAQDSTLLWLWQTNFLLGASAGIGGSVTGGGTWHAAGQIAQIGAVASNYYHFNAWTGAVPPGSETSNPLQVTMDQAKTVAASFAANLATNGVPEWWLARYGFTNNFNAAALADQDIDGQPTWAEWVTQTDPTNSASFFAATRIRWIDGLPVVSWPSLSNRLYSVDRATNLAAAGWSPVATDLPATPTENSYTDAPPAETWTPFYRLRVRMQ